MALHPRSGWNASLLTSLGFYDLHDGYFTRAIGAWREAWTLGKDATDPHARASVDLAVGELARLYASFGQFDNLATLFKEMNNRPVTGPAIDMIQEAAEDLTQTYKDPHHLFNCGPVALAMLLQARDAQDHHGDFLAAYRTGPRRRRPGRTGPSGQAQAGLPHRLVRREPGQPAPLMSLVHWKVGHYGAIVGEANGRYHIVDGAFPMGGLWVTRDALDKEASGYFLVATNDGAPADVRAAPWRPVTDAEAGKIWGRGGTVGTIQGAPHDPCRHGCAGRRTAECAATTSRNRPSP